MEHVLAKRVGLAACVLAGSSSWGQQVTVCSPAVRVSLNSGDRVCPPFCTFDQTVSGATIPLPKFDPSMGTLTGASVSVSASGSGVFRWTLFAEHAPGGYATNVRVRPSVSAPGATGVSADFMIPDCGQPVGRFEYEGTCSFSAGFGGSPARAVSSGSLGSYVGTGNLSLSSSVRFNAELFISGLPFLSWRDEVYADLTVCATYTYCGADFTGDGFVDFMDLDAFVECFEFGVCPAGRTADYNRDGFVDYLDLDTYLAAFEAGC
ncbi:MAG: choice-of-anchor E domain-containing protein [Phycisphaeraceae bacterium]|nr:MAG: choice-of-anchor E domain-containing protein [Phycisphaeraceae bacterium]